MHPNGNAEIPLCTVGGTLVSKVAQTSQSGTISLVRRRSRFPVEWRCRQPFPMLLWMRSGLQRYRLDLGGSLFTSNKPTLPMLIVLPAQTSALGEVEMVAGEAEFAVFFLNKTERAVPLFSCLEEPVVDIANNDLNRTLSAFAREAVAPDNLFDILSESWTMQALAYLSRSARSVPSKHYGGLTNIGRRHIEDYLRVHMSEKILITDLARSVGISPRHFLRAFRQSFNSTPLQFIMELRIQEAKRRLTSTAEGVTEVALACGFSHTQHFSTTFRKYVGTTPSEFRRIVQG